MTDKTAPKSDTVADAIPAQQKEALSQAFTASMSSLNDMSGKSKQAVQAVADSGTMAAKTMQTLNTRAMAYSKKAAEEAIAAAKAMATAKTPQEVLQLQTNFAQSAFSAYVAEFTAVSGLLVDSIKQSVAPFQGLTQNKEE
jgi:phasin family protein